MSREQLGTLLSGEDMLAMYLEALAEKLSDEYKDMPFPEVAALHNINLSYAPAQESAGLRAVTDTGRYIFLDPKQRSIEQHKRFYLLLASFVFDDRAKN